ncbi:DUF3027 domain-containing protein [Pauljensenia sp. UMB0018B]|uniref:DUF3027 domain-containing protein n=1 Tax=Schaalia odontolytica TaxID=1660 RepID=A0A2I1I1Q1_9ACTO|nr:DUF3027 domain-containing protein [Schaalia odontolytica]MDK7338965.1 DUF3027 domain-containing protein [Pauljensenia sp. UMB0018B]PKY65062.1 DUF3027 domain-containing protein [Schaalia odontolytica]
MPKTQARVRAVKKDAVLEDAVDVARAGAEAVAYPRPVGEHVGFEMVSERLATHYFASTDAGYVGWCWAVTVARVPRGRVATVCEVDMTPREGALLAPEWVPWEERLRPSDISRDDVLPYKADDERLEQGFEDTSEDPDLPVVRELGLGRPRVLSQEGIDQAAKRWYESDRGPKSGRRPRNTCSSCGFLMKMSGGMRTMFGVCANEWATDDGAVVSLDHTCGSHSETDVPKNGTAWPVRPSRVNEGALDAEPMPRASSEAKKEEPQTDEVDKAEASEGSEQAG